MPANYDLHVDNVANFCETVLGTASLVDMKTAQANTIFTVPTNRTAVITKVIVRNASGTLVGGTSYTMNGFQNGTAFSLATLVTSATGMLVVSHSNTVQGVVVAGGTAIALTVGTGATSAATATVDVLGYYV